MLSISPQTCYERSVNHPGLPAGDHYWYVYVDAYGVVSEADENNNRNYYGMNI